MTLGEASPAKMLWQALAKDQDSGRLTDELWSCITSEERRIVEAARCGQRIDFETCPALRVVEVTYTFCGRTPKPILQSISEQCRLRGEGVWDAVERIVPVMLHARAAKIPVICEIWRHGRQRGSDRIPEVEVILSRRRVAKRER